MDPIITDAGTGAAADPAAEAAAAAAATAAATPAVTDTSTATDTAAATATAATDAEAAATAAAEAAKAKPSAASRRFAHLTARSQQFEADAIAATRRADAAEALLRAGTPDPSAPPPVPTRQPATDVEARAQQIVAEQAADARRQAVVAAGHKEFGQEDWNQKAAVLQAMGATRNPGFMDALIEADHGPKIVAHFADEENADELDALLKMTPAAISVRIGRMDAELGKPAVRPLSGAPPPAKKVEGAAVLPTVDLYNYPPEMSMSEYAKIIDAQLPPHLGGKRKVA